MENSSLEPVRRGRLAEAGQGDDLAPQKLGGDFGKKIEMEVLSRRDGLLKPVRLPTVGSAGSAAVFAEKTDVAKLHAGRFPDGLERLLDFPSRLAGIEIDEAGGNVRDDLFKIHMGR